ENVLCAELLIVAAGHDDLAAAGQLRGALDPGDAVLLEEAFDALGQPGDDLVLTRVHDVEVQRRLCAAEADAPDVGVLRDLQRVRVLEQRLGRDAAPDQARAAEGLLALDDSRLQTKLPGTDSGHIAAGA